MRCEIVEIPGAHWCKTHEWIILHAVTPGYLCPIGRIERARDAALKKIEEAVR
jgi:hypothetical protein